MSKEILRIENLNVCIDNKRILEDINLEINEGEIHSIFGPNGSGKSTLCFTIMGNPKCKILSGRILYKGKDITSLKPYERAREGIFLSFQTPPEIEHVNMMFFLQSIYHKYKSEEDSDRVKGYVRDIMKKLQLRESILNRGINENLSGGEKKKSEILQMLLLNPELIILDEIDTGLDIDSLKKVFNIINDLNKKKRKTFIIISHNQKMLHYIKPNKIHIMLDGKIVYSTTNIQEIENIMEREGYRGFRS